MENKARLRRYWITPVVNDPLWTFVATTLRIAPNERRIENGISTFICDLTDAQIEALDEYWGRLIWGPLYPSDEDEE